MIKLVAVVLYENEQRLEAVIEDSDGKRRRIDLVWKSKDPTGIPSHWWDSIIGEVEFQRTEEFNKNKGRVQF